MERKKVVQAFHSVYCIGPPNSSVWPQHWWHTDYVPTLWQRAILLAFKIAIMILANLRWHKEIHTRCPDNNSVKQTGTTKTFEIYVSTSILHEGGSNEAPCPHSVDMLPNHHYHQMNCALGLDWFFFFSWKWNVYIAAVHWVVKIHRNETYTFWGWCGC